jgi:hypothetical protein
MKRGVFALATPALAGWDTQKGEVPPSAETAARWRQLVVSGLDWALGLGLPWTSQKWSRRETSRAFFSSAMRRV